MNSEAPKARPPRASRLRLLVAGGVILAALGFLMLKGVTSAVVFFKTANEAVAQRAEIGNATFQLEGTVVKGTVHKLGGDIYRFAISSKGAKVDVTNAGDPPEMFRPGMPVVVVGHFVGSSDAFSSDQIMVKHSQSYVAAHPGRVKASDGSSR
ncbi:MAG: cytochrome c maturation protein CcmE [Acidimicrobiales bacterium]